MVELDFEGLGDETFVEADPMDGLVVAFAGVDGSALVVEDAKVSHAVRHDILRVPPLGGFHGVVVVGVEVKAERADFLRLIPFEAHTGLFVERFSDPGIAADPRLGESVAEMFDVVGGQGGVDVQSEVSAVWTAGWHPELEAVDADALWRDLFAVV